MRMSDSLATGQRFRLLTLVDNMSRESPAIEVDRSLTGARVVAVLERLAAQRGLPKVLRSRQWPRVHLASPRHVGAPAWRSNWRLADPARPPLSLH